MVTPQATGIVTFKNGQTDLGTAPLGSSAIFTTSMLTEGAHSISAVYEGDAAFDPSTSAPVVQMVAAAALSAPGMFLATATSASSVALSWSPVSGATGYEVSRTTSAAGGYALAATTSGTAAVDGLPLSANTTYLYNVRAVGPGGPSPFSSIDIATTTVFDDPVRGGVIVKAAHVLQLRTAVHAGRFAADRAPFVFSDSPSLAGMTIKELHITELREALDEARAGLGFGALPYTDPTVTPGITAVKADHILQLRV